jgi:NAD(P)-dependent dehydrogenase (short-subunit alcohol dehydrogenase family)
MSLKDKTVVVTGGSRGLGLGLVEALVAHGAKVTVVARESDALESVHTRLGVAVIPATSPTSGPLSAFSPRFARTSWCSTLARSRAWGGSTS